MTAYEILLRVVILVCCLSIPFSMTYIHEWLSGWRQLAKQYKCVEAPAVKCKLLFIYGTRHRFKFFPVTTTGSLLYVGTDHRGIYFSPLGANWFGMGAFHALWIPWTDIAINDAFTSSHWLFLRFRLTPAVTIGLYKREIAGPFAVAPAKLAKESQRR